MKNYIQNLLDDYSIEIGDLFYIKYKNNDIYLMIDGLKAEFWFDENYSIKSLFRNMGKVEEEGKVLRNILTGYYVLEKAE